MKSAAKRRNFFSAIIALALLFCASHVASANVLEISKTRAELKTDLGQNRVGESLFYSVKHGENYDSLEAIALESSVATNSTARTVFRGERSSVTPEIVFEQGLKAKGGNTDLLRHVTSNQPDTNFISSSVRPKIATGFSGRNNGHVFVIKTRNGIDVNKTLGAKSPFPEQFEIAIPNNVPNTQVFGAFRTKKGQIIGDFIKNPNFRKP